MRRPALLGTLVSLLTIAVLQAGDTSLDGWFDLQVPGGSIALSGLGIGPEERALTLPLVARALSDRQSRLGRSPQMVAALLAAANVPTVGSVTDAETISIPVPLDAETWREVLALKPTDDLLTRLLTDRAALLLAVGLMATDRSIRTLLAEDRDLLRSLYRETAGSFAVASRHLRLENRRVVVPGGAGAEQIWERLAGSPPTRPAAFIRSLLSRDAGRLAWYFDTIASMDPARLAVAWPAGAARRERATALYGAFRDSDPQWRVIDQPFRRTIADAWTVVMLSEIADGRLMGPGSLAFWQLVFDGDADPRRLEGGSTPLSLPWLAETTAAGTVRDRRDRFEVFRLAQRVFPNLAPADLPDLVVALSGHGRFRSLLLALERMQIASPRTWALIVKAARHVTSESEDRQESTVVFQAVVGVIERIRHVRAIDVETADRLLRSFSEAVQKNRDVCRSSAEWIERSLVPVLPRLEKPDAWTAATAYESTILQALAGPRDRRTPSIQWEGLDYRVDLVAAEHDRLREVRAQMPSPGLDAAMSRGNPRDLATALTALLYTTALGEPDGAITLSRDIATRHDLGFDATTLVRQARPWSPPEERQGTGPWHVQGSLIGLDLALARLALRRIGDDQIPSAPTLTINDFTTFTRTVVALVPFDLNDADRDELAAAIARGRQRIAEARGDLQAIEALAREARASAIAIQVLPWVAARQPESLTDAFSLRDLMWLGKPALSKAQLDRWGIAGDGLDGRRTTTMAASAPWEDFAGRSEVGQVATQAPDLTLRLVEETARLKLPAMLIPSLLAYAVNDYWHDVQARFADDWPRLTQQARALSGTRVEDYVAALAGDGPLRAK
jgi:hypothetical protein